MNSPKFDFGSALYIQVKRKLPFYKKIWNVLTGNKQLNYTWKFIGEGPRLTADDFEDETRDN